jgi:hypothetical protein
MLTHVLIFMSEDGDSNFVNSDEVGGDDNDDDSFNFNCDFSPSPHINTLQTPGVGTFVTQPQSPLGVGVFPPGTQTSTLTVTPEEVGLHRACVDIQDASRYVGDRSLKT